MVCNNIRINGIYSLHLIGLILLFPILLCIGCIKWFFTQWQKEDDVKGEVAVVTGSAQGLGRKLAIELAKRGCHIAVVDILEDSAKTTAAFISETYKVKAKAYKVDISNYQQLVEFHSQVTKDFGDVTILVNNAGLVLFSDSHQRDFAEIQKIVTVNFTSHMWLNQLFLSRMKALNRGHIMATSSLSALLPLPILQIYAPTKSAVRSYMACLRSDLKSANCQIKVSTIMPTYLNTHQPTNDFLLSSGLCKLFPMVDGDVVAQLAVEGMLRGMEELVVPQVCSLVYKLLELLPSWIRDISLGVNRLNLNKLLLYSVKIFEVTFVCNRLNSFWT